MSVTEQFLDFSFVITSFEKMGSEAMAQGMGYYVLGDSSGFRGSP
jgi:hypothetical protein